MGPDIPSARGRTQGSRGGVLATGVLPTCRAGAATAAGGRGAGAGCGALARPRGHA